jgi:hypothetical protein
MLRRFGSSQRAIFLFAAARAGSSLALLIALYLKGAWPHNPANALSSASSRNVMT